MVYYNPYYWNTQYLMLYDIPLFLLFFSLIYILTKYIIRLNDSTMSAATAAFAASVAFYVVRSQEFLYDWFLWNWQGMFGLIVILFSLILIYIIIRT